MAREEAGKKVRDGGSEAGRRSKGWRASRTSSPRPIARHALQNLGFDEMNLLSDHAICLPRVPLSNETGWKGRRDEKLKPLSMPTLSVDTSNRFYTISNWFDLSILFHSSRGNSSDFSKKIITCRLKSIPWVTCRSKFELCQSRNQNQKRRKKCQFNSSFLCTYRLISPVVSLSIRNAPLFWLPFLNPRRSSIHSVSNLISHHLNLAVSQHS